jgi:hypothetical protein
MGLGHSPSIIPDGLVFYFDPINTRSYAGTGLTGFNLIDTAIVGTFTNGPVYDIANKGSVYFDGVDDRISFSFNSALDISQSITIEAYIKPQSYPTAGGGGMIVTKVASYYLEFGSNGKIRVYFFGVNSPGYHESVNTVPLNKWTHTVVTRDISNNTINIYINGILDRTVSSITGNITVQQTQSLTMGGHNGGGYLFVGLITCGKIYNRALSSTEILQNYNVTKKRFSPEENIVKNGLVLYYDAGNNLSYAGTGNTAFSVAGIGYTATLLNGPTFTSTAGGGFVFDATFKYILMPSVIDSNNDLTVSFWNRRLSTGSIHNLLHGVDQSAYFQVRYNASNAVQLVKSNAADMGSFTGYTSTANNDVYLTVRFTKSSNTYDLYINGSYISSITNAQTFVTNGPLLGSGYPGSEHFNGYIYSFTYYNRVLTSTEILQNYNALKSRYGLS